MKKVTEISGGMILAVEYEEPDEQFTSVGLCVHIPTAYNLPMATREYDLPDLLGLVRDAPGGARWPN